MAEPAAIRELLLVLDVPIPTAFRFLGNTLATIERPNKPVGPAGIQPIGVAHRRPTRQHVARSNLFCNVQMNPPCPVLSRLTMTPSWSRRRNANSSIFSSRARRGLDDPFRPQGLAQFLSDIQVFLCRDFGPAGRRNCRRSSTLAPVTPRAPLVARLIHFASWLSITLISQIQSRAGHPLFARSAQSCRWFACQSETCMHAARSK